MGNGNQLFPKLSNLPNGKVRNQLFPLGVLVNNVVIPNVENTILVYEIQLFPISYFVILDKFPPS